MVPTYFLDTNIFLRYIHLSNLKSYRECKSLFELIKQGKIQSATSTNVLAEISWTLKSYYHYPKIKNTAYLQSICHIPHLSIKDDAQIHRALYYFDHFNIKFIDCLIASSKHLQKRTWQLVSYDTDFDKIKGLKRLEPGDIV